MNKARKHERKWSDCMHLKNNSITSKQHAHWIPKDHDQLGIKTALINQQGKEVNVNRKWGNECNKH